MRLIKTLLPIAISCILAGLAFAQPPSPPSAKDGQKAIALKWSGKVALDRTIEIPEGGSLEIAPGTEIWARAEGKLIIRGALKATGTAQSPVRFSPSTPKTQWGGILLERAAGPNEVSFCQILGAGIDVAESELVLKDSSISGGEKGITISSNSNLVAERLTVTDVATHGIMVFVGSRCRLTDSRIERAKTGVELSQKGLIHISGASISECETGLLLTGENSVVEKSTFTRNETAILTVQAGRNASIRGNLLTDNPKGIFCKQYSAPLITENTIRGSREGVVCFQGSSPRILKNLIENNEQGISAIQLSQPLVEKNILRGNRSAVYLTLSSYAVIRGNNFDRNDAHVELDNMSADWEIKVSAKSPRGLAARNIAMAGKGKAESEEIGGPAFTKDYILAQGNWWGQETTAEMTTKGEAADIGAIKDFYDVPYRKYDGYEGEYVQDKVRYSKWLTEPAADAGPSPK